MLNYQEKQNKNTAVFKYKVTKKKKLHTWLN